MPYKKNLELLMQQGRATVEHDQEDPEHSIASLEFQYFSSLRPDLTTSLSSFQRSISELL